MGSFWDIAFKAAQKGERSAQTMQCTSIECLMDCIWWYLQFFEKGSWVVLVRFWELRLWGLTDGFPICSYAR